MSFTENLSPGLHADEKPPVGMNMAQVYGPVTALPPEINERAMRYVAKRATDAQNARNLLEHLGLLDPLMPKAQWKRANTPKAKP